MYIDKKILKVNNTGKSTLLFISNVRFTAAASIGIAFLKAVFYGPDFMDYYY